MKHSTFVLSENARSHRERLNRERTLRLPDGSTVRLLAIEDSPQGRWLKIRPGGWVPAIWLEDL